MAKIFYSCFLMITITSFSQTPAPGPYYFVSDNVNGNPQFYWGGISNYGGIKVVENFNLLAAVLGDNPSTLLQSGQQLVATASFDFGGGTVVLQPFAYTVSSSTKKYNLPIGTQLKNFLNDPLGGAKFDLTLPFSRQDVALSDNSALLRISESAGTWHTAIDLDVTNATTEIFDVIAPADGVVEGNVNTVTLAIRHTASNGKPFLTIYSHINPSTKSHLTPGTPVKRGQKIGTIEQGRDSLGNKAYSHLHFGVAVRGPSKIINGVNVPEMWYLIDPFGVYDYRRNRFSSSTYNYLPNNDITSPVKEIRHAYAFRTNPVIGSLLLPEDCVSFNPNNITVKTIDATTYRIVDGTHSLFEFNSLTEATHALTILKHYNINKSCFIGRPNPSFTYLLVDNQSPVNAVSGEDCVSFNPSVLSLHLLADGKWQMRSGTHSLFVFPNMLEAGNALSIIKKYGFNKVCYVGRPNPSLQYLRK